MPKPSPARAPRPWVQRLKLALFRFYPPYLGAGIRIVTKDPERGVFESEMKLRWWNRNYLGTQFGGSLYSMCDPFFLLILAVQLGPGYVVWDKSASIRFRRPGRGTVRARFEIPPERVEAIRRQVDELGKVEPVFAVEVKAADGELVAEVEKVLYVRKRS